MVHYIISSLLGFIPFQKMDIIMKIKIQIIFIQLLNHVYYTYMCYSLINQSLN